MSDMFEHLEAQAEEENLPFKNAAAIAIDRSERRFGSFVASAKGRKEFDARIALVEEHILKIAADTCEEYGYNDVHHIARLVLGQLELLAADEEHQELPTQNPDGYYTQQSGPAMNPGSAGDNMKNTNPSIPELTPDDKQHPSDKEWPWDSEIPRTGDGLTQVDANKPMQPEFNVGDHTMTFPNKGQADPVTSKTAMIASAERMSFDILSETMKPSEAIEYLKEAGMPSHEAEDRVWEYVNHHPEWASKHWTSAVDPLDEMSDDTTQLEASDEMNPEEDPYAGEYEEMPESDQDVEDIDDSELEDIKRILDGSMGSSSPLDEETKPEERIAKTIINFLNN